MKDSRLRVGGWVRHLGGMQVDAPANHPAADGEVTQGYDHVTESIQVEPEAWRDPGDRWDGGASPDTGGAYRGRRRRGGGRSRWRVAAVAAVVATLLLGSAALAQLRRDDPVTLAPPPTPDRAEPMATPAATRPGGDARLGEAAPATPSPTTEVVVPTPPAASSPSPSPTSVRTSSPPDSPSPPAPPIELSYEAENAERSGETDVRRLSGASGERVVVLAWYGAVTFAGVTVDAPGEYLLTVHYLSSWQRTVEVRVNNDDAQEVRLAPIDDGIGTASLPVPLAAGENRIRISDDRWGPALDRIVVSGGETGTGAPSP